MRVGFTGTRAGMSAPQMRQLSEMLVMFTLAARGMLPTIAPEFHFGGSGKSDLAARVVAKALGYAIHWHPCPGIAVADLPPPLREEAEDETWHQVFPPLVRNQNIVAAADVLIATPETDREQTRTGTWATIRYARKAEKPVVMLSRGLDLRARIIRGAGEGVVQGAHPR